MRPWQLVSPELARSLCEISREIGRQVGVLLDRRGYVQQVMVGNDHKLVLPDLGRFRGGRTHFRGVRLVHVHLRQEPLNRDDLSDLALLRLDYVAAIRMNPDGLPGLVHGAHLLPGDTSATPWRLEEFRDVHELDQDILATIDALEAEFARKVGKPSAVAGAARAVLVVVTPHAGEAEDTLLELRELARTAQIEVLGTAVQLRRKPDSKYAVGHGKLEELVVDCMQKGADLVVFGNNLTPAQARHIADFCELKVIDRTQLILDIFARRAQSQDGKLQVELAQLKYRLPRLSAEDSGLSRLVGFIGGRGPGETKLEIDRRRARERITRLEREIEKLSCRRGVRRALRSHNRLPVVSIVGYTNAGKSTLLNQLTHSQVLVEDKLFATLDPTSRRLRFPRDRHVIVTDTVGFIRDLPPDLARAFRATFEELGHSDLLLHVVDSADPRLDDQMAAVVHILEELELAQVPRLVLLNKVDRISAALSRALERRTGGLPISATTKRGFEQMLSAVEEILWHEGATAKNAILPAEDEPCSSC